MIFAIGLADATVWWRRRGRGRGGVGIGGIGFRRVQTATRRTEGRCGTPEDRGGDRGRLLRTELDEQSRRQTFKRIADELHRQYALAFMPQNLDGKTHKLEVRLKNPDLVARARKTYVAKKGM